MLCHALLTEVMTVSSEAPASLGWLFQLCVSVQTRTSLVAEDTDMGECGPFPLTFCKEYRNNIKLNPWCAQFKSS